MNGVHDMGGMHGMGPIRHEENEPAFHEPWEGRVYAMTRVVRAGGGRQNLDNSRHLLELLPPAEYLRMSYYERWLARLEKQLVDSAIVTREELETARRAPDAPTAEPRITAAMVPDMVARRNSARNMHPTGHTRLPRYARGKLGVVVRDHGVFVFPDTNAAFAGEKPQHVYSVRFAARELWGAQASPHDCVHLDMWDDYLDHA